MTEWSVVCYLDEVVFQWTLNTSKRNCWKGYFSVAFSFEQLKRGNWFTGYLATQWRWNNLLFQYFSFSPDGNIPSILHADMYRIIEKDGRDLKPL